ncbi:MAG: hypothetical protein ACOVQ4_01495 [Flectobacillus sp.]|uniref:hypothetical protein n=1 Tax=Flectobacillus sp. TaxID=50419 RepID=UPI003B9AD8C2
MNLTESRTIYTVKTPQRPHYEEIVQKLSQCCFWCKQTLGLQLFKGFQMAITIANQELTFELKELSSEKNPTYFFDLVEQHPLV